MHREVMLQRDQLSPKIAQLIYNGFWYSPEMEALTAVSVACLTVYDMVKAVERGMRIEGIRLVEKRGGKSGHYKAKG